MIKVNDVVIKSKYFPDGTLNLSGHDILGKQKDKNYTIQWKFENNEELVILYFISRHLDNLGAISKELFMNYIPNARQDRSKHDTDVFTLKYFAELINSMNFSKVYVLDPHSPVSEALINNIDVVDIKPLVIGALNDIKLFTKAREIILYFPDNGAAKKYEDMFKGFKTCYGIKHRDWNTGVIQGLEVVTNGIDLKDKTVLMIDDIISYGGSLFYSALKLKELGAKHICAYVSHCENSILDKEKGNLIKSLEDGTVEKLYTTKSLFTGTHKNIEVIKLWRKH